MSNGHEIPAKPTRPEMSGPFGYVARKAAAFGLAGLAVASLSPAVTAKAAPEDCIAAGTVCDIGNSGSVVTGLKNVVDIAAGLTSNNRPFQVALESDGSVYTWGDDTDGELGNGKEGSKATPTKIAGLNNVVDVVAGGWDGQTYAIKSDGTVFAWGSNEDGQIGNGAVGNDKNATSPTQVKDLAHISSIAVGGNTTYAVATDGSVYTWGQAGYGTYDGNGGSSAFIHSTPVKISSLKDVTAVVGANEAAFALKGDGTVWSWGVNRLGQLGQVGVDYLYKPTQIQNLPEIKQLSGGFQDFGGSALGVNGKTYAWGSNEVGQLGNGQDGPGVYEASPVEVPGISNINKLFGNGFQTFAIQLDGTVLTWGWDNNYAQGSQAQNGVYNDTPNPVVVNELNNPRVISATSKSAFSLAAGAKEMKRPYVALGDSYSSGEGNPPFINTTAGKACHRSNEAWPNVYAGKSSKFSLVANLACSGAKATSALEVGYREQPPEFTAMKSLDPSLVTMTIGGNDIGFGPILSYCFTRGIAHQQSKCESYLSGKAGIVDSVGKMLLKYYSDLKKSAPAAKIAIVGYPRLFPETQQETKGCGWLSDGGRKKLNDLAIRLDATLKKDAKSAGFTYISELNSLDNHELCTKNPSWLNPIASGTINTTYYAHPTTPGQNAMASAVTRALG